MRIIPDVVSSQTVRSLPRSASARDAADLMMRNRISAVLIVEDGNLLGIVTERDMAYAFAAENRDADAVTVGEVMTPSPDTIEPNDKARDALELMEIKGYRHLPVVDDGRVIGIVSVRDLYGAVKRQLARQAEMTQNVLVDKHYIAR